MAVRYVETSVGFSGLDDGSFELDHQADRHAPRGGISLGAFRGLAFALAIEATLAGMAGLGVALWHFLH
jgi:hypothetical protein